MSTMQTPTRNYINLPVILKGQKLDVLLDILTYVLDQQISYKQQGLLQDVFFE